MMRFLLIFGFVGLISLAIWLLLRSAPSEESLYTQMLKLCLGDD